MGQHSSCNSKHAWSDGVGLGQEGKHLVSCVESETWGSDGLQGTDQVCLSKQQLYWPGANVARLISHAHSSVYVKDSVHEISRIHALCDIHWVKRLNVCISELICLLLFKFYHFLILSIMQMLLEATCPKKLTARHQMHTSSSSLFGQQLWVVMWTTKLGVHFEVLPRFDT